MIGTILSAIGYILLALILRIVYKHIAYPYYLYKKYVKYGRGEFYPILGVFYGAAKRVKKFKDVDHHLKHMFDDGDASTRLYVENNPSNVVVKLADADLIKEFVQLENTMYNKSPVLIDNLVRLVGRGVIFSEGPHWKKNRTVLSGVFHFESLQKRVPTIEKITKDVFLRYINKPDGLKNVDMIELFQEITAEVVVQTFFSNASENKKFYGMTLAVALSYLLNTVGRQAMSPGYFLFGTKYFELGLTQYQRDLNKQIKEFRVMIEEIIQGRIDEEDELEKRGETSTKEDLIYYLKKNNLLKELTLDQITSEFMTFYVAGMDTTGHLCGMTAWYLTQYDTVKATLQKELDANTDYSQKGLLNLPYLNGVISETQRLYGPAGQLFNRVALNDHYLKDIFIKKGTQVKPVPVAIHRNPKYWEDPQVFKPERWVNKSTMTPYAFIPFHAGPRNCIGQHLALIEARIFINTLMKTFDFELDPTYEMKLNYAFLIEPVNPLRINLKVKDMSLLK